MKDVLRDLELHYGRIDWSDPSLTPARISRILLGHENEKFPAYWQDPEFEGLTPWQIERQILFEAGRTNWGEQGFYGKPNYQHFLMLISLMFPKTDITPSLADSVMVFCLSLTGGRKLMNLIGSQNSSKSASFARIAYAAMYIDPDYTMVNVANPFDNAADSTIYGDIEELWDELCEAHPNDTGRGKGNASSLFPYAIKYAKDRIEFIPNTPKAARIVLKNVKHVGKYKGQKTRGKEAHRGLFLLGIDEVNEIQNMAFLSVLPNISSQAEFFGITSQNFKDEQDMGGRLTEPEGEAAAFFDRPMATCYDELDIERDLFWYSKYSSITLRFDGLKSPNILAGRTIYGYLFKQEDLDRIKGTTGEHSLDYFSQVRSFPIRGGELNSVLSTSKVTASRHKDPYWKLESVSASLGFCDPAFGGRDKALYGNCKIGMGMVMDGEGNEHRQELVIFEDNFRSLSLVKDAFYNDYWFERLKALGVDTREFQLDDPVIYEDQLAIQCLEFNQQYGVPARNFGYDFSMRPEVGPSMTKIVGTGSVPFDYRGKPEGAHLFGVKRNSEECCKNRTTELAFLAADLFITKQVRIRGNIDTAIMQLSRTQYTTVGGNKWEAEDKIAYKARWQQVSPDHRDVLMGLAGMAVKRGFRKGNLTGPTSTEGNVFSEIFSRGIGRSRVGRHLSVV